jgi:hypothetical protein
MNDSLLSRFEVTEAKRPLLKIAGFTGKDFKLGRLRYPHRMRAERLFVAAATTVLWFLQRQFLPRNVQRLCVRARETLSVFVQAFSPAAGAQAASWREDHRGISNGDQVYMVSGLAMKHGPSVDFCGYWQRPSVGY